MRKRAFFFILILFFSLSFVLGETNGYLSFEYISNYRGSSLPPPTFKNIQMGVLFSGEITKGFGYVAEARIREEIVNIEQALISYTISDYLSFGAGLFLVPFGIYNQANRPHETLFIKPPLHVEEMYPLSWRDIGIVVEGDLGFLFYSSYIANGLAEGEDIKSNQKFEDNNKDKARGGRVGLYFGRDFSAGVSYYRGNYDVNGERNLTLQGADVIWEIMGFQILGEYAKAVLENPEPFVSGEATGYFIQASFRLWFFQPVGSYQCLKHEDPFHGTGFTDSLTPGVGILLEKTRWTVGLVFSPIPNLLIKIEYDFDQDKILGIKNNTFLVQTALGF